MRGEATGLWTNFTPDNLRTSDQREGIVSRFRAASERDCVLVSSIENMTISGTFKIRAHYCVETEQEMSDRFNREGLNPFQSVDVMSTCSGCGMKLFISDLEQASPVQSFYYCTPCWDRMSPNFLLASSGQTLDKRDKSLVDTQPSGGVISMAMSRVPWTRTELSEWQDKYLMVAVSEYQNLKKKFAYVYASILFIRPAPRALAVEHRFVVVVPKRSLIAESLADGALPLDDGVRLDRRCLKCSESVYADGVEKFLQIEIGYWCEDCWVKSEEWPVSKRVLGKGLGWGTAFVLEGQQSLDKEVEVRDSIYDYTQQFMQQPAPTDDGAISRDFNRTMKGFDRALEGRESKTAVQSFQYRVLKVVVINGAVRDPGQMINVDDRSGLVEELDRLTRVGMLELLIPSETTKITQQRIGVDERQDDREDAAARDYEAAGEAFGGELLKMMSETTISGATSSKELADVAIEKSKIQMAIVEKASIAMALRSRNLAERLLDRFGPQLPSGVKMVDIVLDQVGKGLSDAEIERRMKDALNLRPSAMRLREPSLADLDLARRKIDQALELNEPVELVGPMAMTGGPGIVQDQYPSPFVDMKLPKPEKKEPPPKPVGRPRRVVG